MKSLKTSLISAFTICGLALFSQSCSKAPQDSESPSPETQPATEAQPAAKTQPATEMPETTITLVELDTSKGKIVIELNDERAPNTVKNFLQYVDDGFYTNIAFHRVIPDFMIQVGGFEEKDGNITKKATRTPIQNEANNGLKNEKGTLAMARTGDPHSASAQFFINHKDNDFLNHTSEDARGWGYTVFGKVVEGMDVVNAIAAVETGVSMIDGSPMKDVPVETILLKSAKRVKE